MKYAFLIILFLFTFSVQASYCSGRNWRDAYQSYTHNIDLLNYHIDRYNVLLDKNNWTNEDDEKYTYLIAKLAVEELDQLNIDVENLDNKFNKVKYLWQLISEHCLHDDELDYNNMAIKNARGADIGRQEVNDLLAKIKLLKLRFLKNIKFINDN
ncbi:Putative uncharacterized protein [Moritella viscosa]|uniref:Uncharacterized protein n=1 Tax=Moritella viscosa TaxID=80854 RepID=A0A090IAK0_9GAMM|nr:hypothetical protein [Moritella viscosa]CED59005.1 putative exported protein [Moritella viscosa]SGZ07866.1 Putative uncharacterized protein [Moritella viscosa]SGZ17723.1 Putative uncharacterized protein [Moritella viscosa]SHN98858.1 Putative uncharacterized protein [Moritella viscosa]SHN98859.1 Putative uncharacterized protein [Moritella viscosa]